ncbi:MAG TPA: NAD(P)/FAD-dependent oxidoreductase [Dehalococcoidia bacterium]|nr:NAD(P)/FAD-dependent oxidoreductase [Dehalococcoidia bacterium]
MYDVIIVGARCAGSPLAMLLAKKGRKVLVVDRATFPSDIMSTHYIQPEGVKRLQEWGLYDRVMASNCPPIPSITFTLGGVPIVPPRDQSMPDAICPRRTVLDKILVDAARAAGAEVREGFSVQEILIEDGAVVGLRGRNSDGTTVEERARITVGADGQHSIVARAVQAREYDTHPAASCGYYSYFSGVPLKDGCAEAYVGNDAGVLAFPTNDELTCVGAGGPHDIFHAYRADIESTFYRLVERASPAFADRLRAGTREERWIGTADTANFFRQPYGPGWALCGDAGYHKDFVTGLGIADAFRDAEFLSEGLDAGLSGRAPLDEALAAYQKRRDETAKPMYDLTVQFAQFPSMEEMAANMANAGQAATGAESVAAEA